MNIRKSCLRLHLLTAAFTGFPLLATAERSPHSLVLQPIVVTTAAGVEVEPLTAPASVTVITGEQIRRSQFVDLTDALTNVPGVSVAGAADGENIFIRGLPSEYTLILIDGKRVDTRQSRTNAAGGVDQFFMPPAAAIDRIEIVRGPMSSLYGSDAMGGVINIITKPVARRWSTSITAEMVVPQDSEDHSEQQISFYATGPVVGDQLGLQIWGRGLDREESERTRGPGEREHRDMNARMVWSPGSDHKLSLELGRSEADTEPRLNFRNTGSVGYEGQSAEWKIDASIAYERAGRTTDGSDREPEIENTILDAKGSREFEAAGRHSFSVGGQYAHAELTDQNPGIGDDVHYAFSNDQWAVFVEDIWQMTPAFALTVGGRHTHDERFGGHFTPRVYGLLEVADNLFISAGAGTGYRTPELRESVEGYYLTTNRGRAVIAGEPTLEPEESTTYEVGVRFDDGDWRFAGTVFQTDFKNAIDSRDTGGNITIGSRTYDLFEYYNVGEARVNGLELSAGVFLSDALEISGSYTYTDSERLTGDLKGQPLARTPDHQFSVRADWETPVNGLTAWGARQYIGNSVSVSSKSWTPLIGQSLDDDKCFLQDERDAPERSDETEKTQPFA